ncbi:MAG: cadherin-like beta sandwich domain-containing protein [Planctomycetota bacterium]
MREQENTTDSRRRRALAAFGLFGLGSLAACSGTARSQSSASESPTLDGLGLSSGDLSPAFDPNVRTYSVQVNYATESLTITPVAGSAVTSVTIQGTEAGASAAVPLVVGLNTIQIVVTGTNGATDAYNLLVVRPTSTCALIPSETQGPFPLSSVLNDPSMVRQDITEGKTGVPLTVHLSLVDINTGCAAIAGAAVYIWHCDKDGAYSGYSSGQNGNHSGETFCRGIQVSDANGNVTFQTIYPGWYTGRITHIHMQVFLNNATGAPAEVTSQLAFPPAVTQAVYNSSLYSAHGQNTSVADFAHDNVFSDGVDLQLGTVTGDLTSGYHVSLTMGIAV